MNNLQPELPTIEETKDTSAALGAEVEGKKFFAGSHADFPLGSGVVVPDGGRLTKVG
jgi:hypothetical protein